MADKTSDDDGATKTDPADGTTNPWDDGSGSAGGSDGGTGGGGGSDGGTGSGGGSDGGTGGGGSYVPPIDHFPIPDGGVNDGPEIGPAPDDAGPTWGQEDPHTDPRRPEGEDTTGGGWGRGWNDPDRLDDGDGE